MIQCPSCQQLATKRDGYDEQGRQRYGCRRCHRDFTATSTSAFSGYRWSADVILTAVRWYAIEFHKKKETRLKAYRARFFAIFPGLECSILFMNFTRLYAE